MPSRTVFRPPAPEVIERYYRGLEPFWHPVAISQRVGDQPVGVRLLGHELVLARLEGRVVAFDDLCRHLGARLSLGDVVDGSCLRCPYHGWTYDATGRCVDIPARRHLPVPEEARVTSYPTQEAYGLVWVCLDRNPSHAIPDFPEFSDSRFYVGPLRTYEPWQASAPRLVMGQLDDTHFAWVHPHTLGDPQQVEAPDHRVWREGDRLVATYTTWQSEHSLSSGGGGPSAPGGPNRVTYTIHATPNTVRLVKESRRGTFVVFEAIQPISYNQSITYWRVARDFDGDPVWDDVHERFQDAVREEDRRVVESQRPWLIPPMTTGLMLYIRPADLPLIEYQRWMEELGIPQI